MVQMRWCTGVASYGGTSTQASERDIYVIVWKNRSDSADRTSNGNGNGIGNGIWIWIKWRHGHRNSRYWTNQSYEE